MPPLDFNLLIALDALLQEASVSRAAKRVGLSTPAMSHALARLRERLKDPVLVRSGRSMQATPRATAMKDEVHALVAYVLTMLGDAVDRNLRQEAPRVRLRFVPNSAEDIADLRDGRADLAVGIYGELPSELRTRSLLTDRFVCVVRRGHPVIKSGLTVEAFAGLEHVQVAPRGKPGGYIDDVLRAKGLERRVARATVTPRRERASTRRIRRPERHAEGRGGNPDSCTERNDPFLCVSLCANVFEATF
jgi:DNA-binding transcriptional LysR family regulator